MDVKDNIVVGEMLKKGIISFEDLSKCLDLQKKATLRGQSRRIENIIIEQGFAALSDIEKIKQGLEGKNSLKKTRQVPQVKHAQNKTRQVAQVKHAQNKTRQVAQVKNTQNKTGQVPQVKHAQNKTGEVTQVKNTENKSGQNSLLSKQTNNSKSKTKRNPLYNRVGMVGDSQLNPRQNDGEEEIVSSSLRTETSSSKKSHRRPKTSQETDFLDSSVSQRLKRKCLEAFPKEQIDEFSNYTILEELGHGNMGIVYKALQKKESKTYALKLLPKRVINDPRAVQLFSQEIFIHRTLRHHNIVRLHKIGVHNDTVFLVMEYVLGSDLNILLQKQENVGVRESLKILADCLQALEHAHSLNIVHRDLKPANILLEEASWTPKISDFGLAKFTKEHLVNDLAFGTPAYMAPEQIQPGKPVDIRVDIYALGCVLYYLLSGRRPYSHIQNPALLLKVKQEENPKKIDEYRPDLSSSVRDLIEKAMERDVKKRFQVPQDFLKATQEALQKEEQKLLPGHRKSPPRPSQRLKDEMHRKSTSFLPLKTAEASQVLMTTIRNKMDPTLETFTQEVSQFMQSPVGSLMTGQDEDENKEFEATLLSMTMVPGAILHIPKEVQNLFIQTKPSFLMNEILALLESSQTKSSDQLILKDLRYVLVLRGNSFTKGSSLIDIFHNTASEVRFKLDEMAGVSQSEIFNQKIRKYFSSLVTSCFSGYDEVFLAHIERCNDRDELECYLQNYPANSQIFQRHKNLEIISFTKRIQEKLEKDPESWRKILETHFSKKENRIHQVLHRLYSQENKDTLFARTISRSKDLATLMRHLDRIQKKPPYQNMADRIINLIEVFLDVGGRSSIQDLKTSLNFIPSHLRNRICFLICQRLKKELEDKVNHLLVSPHPANRRFKSFLQLIQNNRYHHPGIKIYGYSVKDLSETVKLLRVQKNGNKPNVEDLPQEILGLIYEDKEMEVAARAKTLQNCQQRLQSIQKEMEKSQATSLLKSLLKIFYTYERVNFAQDSSVYAISGHEFARALLKYYEDPQVYPLNVLKQLTPNIRKTVGSLIEQEQKLKKS